MGSYRIAPLSDSSAVNFGILYLGYGTYLGYIGIYIGYIFGIHWELYWVHIWDTLGDILGTYLGYIRRYIGYVFADRSEGYMPAALVHT